MQVYIKQYTDAPATQAEAALSQLAICALRVK
jgi:hypothetical protein